MAALAAGDTVIVTASAAPIPHRTRPMAGIVESLGPVVVGWANGVRSSYVVVGSGSTSVLFQVTQTPTHPSLVGATVQIAGLPNPGGRVQGVVVQHFDVLDPAGNNPGEEVVVKTELGYLPVPYVTVTVVPSA